MKPYKSIEELPKKLPIFPLTGAVLFPQTQLPLNIFEPRYVQMIDEALSTPNRIIGMIQPHQTKGTDIKTLKKVGCTGRISSFSETGDGRYLVTLSGLVRFQVAEELPTTTPYRQIIANYNEYQHDLFPESADQIDRGHLLSLIKKYLKQRNLLVDWDIIEQTPTDHLINYSGVLVPFTPEEKQLLLEAKTLIGRCRALEALFQSYEHEHSENTGGSNELH